MTEPHKRPHRHPTYKTAYRVKNWHEYDQALRDRGDITLWMSQDAIHAWTPPQTGKRGAQRVYSDIAIETALTLRLLFRLPLRQTEGFLQAILTLMDLTLPCPDHTTLSRRNATLVIRQQVERASQGPVDLIADSTGLKVCGQGEWHTQKHEEKKCKRWKKLHIGVDDRGQIIASTLTEGHEQDPSQVPEFLSQVGRVIERFIGDGIYDQEPVYAAVMAHSPEARVIVPPRKDAVLSRQVFTAPTQRDQHVLTIASVGRLGWKRLSGYYTQAYAENVFARFKRTFGDRLRTKRDESQRGKPRWLASCSTECLNWVVLSPIQSAKRGIHGGNTRPARFMQQSL
jgi:DDE family transposase